MLLSDSHPLRGTSEEFNFEKTLPKVHLHGQKSSKKETESKLRGSVENRHYGWVHYVKKEWFRRCWFLRLPFKTLFTSHVGPFRISTQLPCFPRNRNKNDKSIYRSSVDIYIPYVCLISKFSSLRHIPDFSLWQVLYTIIWSRWKFWFNKLEVTYTLSTIMSRSLT